jgi:hypothetical protein
MLTATHPDELAVLVQGYLNELERPWEMASVSHATTYMPSTAIKPDPATMFSALVVTAKPA